MRLEPLLVARGTLRVPGDKSIGHRSLLLSAVAWGESHIEGLPDGGDVATTERLLGLLGVPIHRDGVNRVVTGRGWAALDTPAAVLDCGNSGTTARLLLGLLASRRGVYTLTGDESLSRRPMARVVRPLVAMGARIEGGNTLPLMVHGARLHGMNTSTEVASAQVKSAVILAALQAAGDSLITEPAPTRDHTERMLRAMGAPLEETAGGWAVRGGSHDLGPLHMKVPGDPSSAAFFVALAAARPGSALTIEGVGLNPRRTGFLRLLRRMGGVVDTRVAGEDPEPWGTIEVVGGPLRGIEVDGPDITDAIDELPILAVLAAVAEGTTTIRGAGELRLKESDRIHSTAMMLAAFGARVDELPDGLVVHGGARLVGCALDVGQDHRIAMSAAIAASLADGPTMMRGHEWTAISYPRFFQDLASLGGP
jgi:3-phosphoshikimate 1-carboxyvinyltransferase